MALNIFLSYLLQVKSRECRYGMYCEIILLRHSLDRNFINTGCILWNAALWSKILNKNYGFRFVSFFLGGGDEGQGRWAPPSKKWWVCLWFLYSRAILSYFKTLFSNFCLNLFYQENSMLFSQPNFQQQICKLNSEYNIPIQMCSSLITDMQGQLYARVLFHKWINHTSEIMMRLLSYVSQESLLIPSREQ